MDFGRLAVRVIWILSMLAGIAAAGGPELPDQVTTAHTVFLVNETGHSELLYAAVLEMNKWGRFELVESKEKAELVMVLSSGSHVRAVPDGQQPRTVGLNAFVEESVPKGQTKIALVDPKTGDTLWKDYQKTDGGKVKSGHLLDGLRQAFERYDKSRNKK